jgi:macrolide phosphotransferase
MKTQEILALARQHGLELAEVTASNQMGVDFAVAFATDLEGTRWVLRIPRREGMGSQIEREAAVLGLVRRHLPFAVPDWKISAPQLIAYPTLKNELVIRSDLETGELTWNMNRDNPRFADSLANALVRIHSIPVAEAEAAGAKSSSPEVVRSDLLRSIDDVKGELGIGPSLERRWRRWVEDDQIWPGFSTFIHGDLFAGHILVDAHGEISGIIDWSEGQVGDPATDFAGHAAVFGEEALRELISRYERLGGAIWDRLYEHTLERVAATPLVYAEFALRNGLDDHIDAARAMLGLGEATG